MKLSYRAIWIDADVVGQLARGIGPQICRHAHEVRAGRLELILRVRIAGEKLQRPGRMPTAGVRHGRSTTNRFEMAACRGRSEIRNPGVLAAMRE